MQVQIELIELFMISVSIVGASGYSGAELIRILSRNTNVCIKSVIAATSVSKKVAELYPVFSGLTDLEYQSLEDEALTAVDVIFAALPSGESMNIVPQLLGRGSRVIDLSGDFRLPSSKLYEEYYQHPHTSQSLLNEAVYGLPELYLEELKHARLVANPGCYATSIILAILPALQASIISASDIIITSLSGVSGAGRSASLELSFSEVNENIRAYKIIHHQHIPEIQAVLSMETSQNVQISFVPHLVPLTRGIYTTIHAKLEVAITEPEVVKIYEMFYDNAPFVRIKRQIPQT
ncbi:MAG: N-acetyl-gamma-glutamyl-phosphate reductase [Acidobacteriota bacterium]